MAGIEEATAFTLISLASNAEGPLGPRVVEWERNSTARLKGAGTPQGSSMRCALCRYLLQMGQQSDRVETTERKTKSGYTFCYVDRHRQCRGKPVDVGRSTWRTKGRYLSSCGRLLTVDDDDD